MQNIDPSIVSLVERNEEPLGLKVNIIRTGKKDAEDLVQLAHQIQTAHVQVKNNAIGKLSIIAEQIKFLQQQAKQILLDAEKDKQLHNAACNFVKIPGNIYHLYKNPKNNQYFWSMVSPDEWGTCKTSNEFKGSYRLEIDKSYTNIQDIPEFDEKRSLVQELLDSTSSKTNLLAIEDLTRPNSLKN